MRNEPEPMDDELDPRALLRGLARSAPAIAITVVLGGLVGLGAGIVQPDRYVSEGKIEVRLGIRERRTPESALDPASDVPAPLPGIADEIELLDNPVVYERIAQHIGPERLLGAHDPAAGDDADTPMVRRWLHSLQSWWSRSRAPELSPEEAVLEAARVVDEALEIQALSGTSYLLVRATAPTPEQARLLVRTYLDTARQWHREVYAANTELSFVSDQLARYEEEYLAAERAFAQHRDTCGFYDLETQKKSAVATLTEHEERIRENTVRQYEVEDELGFVESELAVTPRSIEKLIQPTLQVNPEYQASLDRLQRLSGERATLASVYNQDSDIFRRKVEQLDDEVRRVEGHLEQTPEFTEYGAASYQLVPNPRFEELTIRRSELRREQETCGRTLALWERAKTEQDERLRAALVCEPLHLDLAKESTRTKARVQELAAALEQAKALALLDRQEEMDSLRIAQDGVLPREKEGPFRTRSLLLGLFGGLAAGLFLATGRFLLDPRLHDPDAVAKELGVDVLAVVPETSAARMPRARTLGGAA